MADQSSILVIDDEPNLRSTLSTIFTRAGHQVTAVGSAEEARRSLEQAAFDLVILDLKLPGVDGRALLPEIHHQYPQTPIIVLSTQTSPHFDRDAIQWGAYDCIPKPVDPAHLLQRLEEILTAARS